MTLDYGKSPSSDVLELTLFGPGYGEAIAIHVGNGNWILVDSCVRAGSKIPATADYLGSIGVTPEQIKVIVASHWHDDHVRGLSILIEKYPQADFFYPAVFSQKEALEFLVAYSGKESLGLSKGTAELYQAFNHLSKQAKTPIAVKNRTEVFEDTNVNQPVRVSAFSPSDKDYSRFIAKIFNYIPRKDIALPITNAPDLTPNFTSIVLHVCIGDEAILLGADLEEDGQFGWGAVLSDEWCRSKRRSIVYKVAHHGSATGDNPKIWEDLLTKRPLALLSPFHNGRHRLPTVEDKERIRLRTDTAFITSASSMKPQLPTLQLKRLSDICKDISISQAGFGAIRARKKIGDPKWEVETFGSGASLFASA